jgi:hypothetical protein
MNADKPTAETRRRRPIATLAANNPQRMNRDVQAGTKRGNSPSGKMDVGKIARMPGKSRKLPVKVI